MAKNYTKRAQNVFLNLSSVDMLDDLAGYLKEERAGYVNALSVSTDAVLTRQLQGKVQLLDDLIGLANNPGRERRAGSTPPGPGWA